MSEVSGPQGQRNAHAKMYNLGGNRQDEPNKPNPWHKYCKEYAAKNNISYAAAISLASPSWRAHKEKNGLSFRDRSRRAERPEPEEEDVAMEQSQKVPRKPKETFRKDQYKRQRPSQPPSPPYEEAKESADYPQTPKKKRVKKAQYSEDDMDDFREFMKYRNQKTKHEQYEQYE